MAPSYTLHFWWSFAAGGIKFLEVHKTCWKDNHRSAWTNKKAYCRSSTNVMLWHWICLLAFLKLFSPWALSLANLVPPFHALPWCFGFLLLVHGRLVRHSIHPTHGSIPLENDRCPEESRTVKILPDQPSIPHSFCLLLSSWSKRHKWSDNLNCSLPAKMLWHHGLTQSFRNTRQNMWKTVCQSRIKRHQSQWLQPANLKLLGHTHCYTHTEAVTAECYVQCPALTWLAASSTFCSTRVGEPVCSKSSTGESTATACPL